MQKTVLKICPLEWENESRDKRELSVYRELGAKVFVLAKGDKNELDAPREAEGFPVFYCTTRPLGKTVPNAINRLVSVFYWAHFARRMNPDLISGHDIQGLLIAWIATWFSGKHPALVYDSHEFELGRNVERNALAWQAVKYLERFLMKRCAFCIMVNDVIADEVQRIHKLKKRPIVVRSTPTRWKTDDALCRSMRSELLPKGADIDNSFIVIYHGRVTTMRGIEELIETAERDKDINAVILGDGDAAYLDSLRKLVKDKQLDDRVIFHSAVPLEELWKYVGAADLSLMMIKANVKSYFYALPNKFFESIQSLTPIVASAFPEMKRLIDRYEIGLCCDPDDPEAIVRCVEKFRTEKAFYERCRENLKRAKDELCWENEKHILLDAARPYLSETETK